MRHSFHIPVMGTGFTIDTPLKVARFGIASVISLVDDRLIEKIRKHYCRLTHEPYLAINDGEPDARARRIREYLDLVARIIERQVERVKASAFTPDSEITRYFEMMEDSHPVKIRYQLMLAQRDPTERARLQQQLRGEVVAGPVEANIMTKQDRTYVINGKPLSREYSDAMCALRGFARAQGGDAVIFSAGLNLHLYGYAEEFEGFHQEPSGRIKKKIVLKVSDFRSAYTQGRIFAKKGLWVSEYRIESGLNCGGHAFPTQGHLLGPILEEFKQQRQEFTSMLFGLYRAALIAKNRYCPPTAPDTRITVQGGIGTGAEHRFLLRYYQLQGAGWGTPFLLVPETTNVDEGTLERLVKAGKSDIVLSHSSPLGIPFFTLKDSASEIQRIRRAESGHPGSPCLNGYLAFNDEFGEALCTASLRYQHQKLDQIRATDLDVEQKKRLERQVTEKACICHDLGDGALIKFGLNDRGLKPVPAVCPGPNLAYFTKLSTLREMVDHIYGRANILVKGQLRPHIFINELQLYVEHLKKLAAESVQTLGRKESEYFAEFKKNLLEGVEYYRKLSVELLEESAHNRDKFINDLSILKKELENIHWIEDIAMAQ